MSLRRLIERGLALQEGAKDNANAAVALTAKAKSENTPEAHTAASLAHKAIADGIADWLTSRGRGYSEKMGWHSSWSDYHREKARSLKTGKPLNQEAWGSYDKPDRKSRFSPPRDKYDGNFYDSVVSAPARLSEAGAAGPSQKCDQCGSHNPVGPSGAQRPTLKSPEKLYGTFHCGNCGHENQIDPKKYHESVATTYYYEFYGNRTGINNRIPICPDCSLPVNETFGPRHPMASGLSAMQCQCKRSAA